MPKRSKNKKTLYVDVDVDMTVICEENIEDYLFGRPLPFPACNIDNTIPEDCQCFSGIYSYSRAMTAATQTVFYSEELRSLVGVRYSVNPNTGAKYHLPGYPDLLRRYLEFTPRIRLDPTISTPSPNSP